MFKYPRSTTRSSSSSTNFLRETRSTAFSGNRPTSSSTPVISGRSPLPHLLFDPLGGDAQNGPPVAVAVRPPMRTAGNRRVALRRCLHNSTSRWFGNGRFNGPATQRQRPLDHTHGIQVALVIHAPLSASRRAGGPRPSRCRAASARPTPAAIPARRGDSGRQGPAECGGRSTRSAMSRLTAACVSARNSGGAQRAARARQMAARHHVADRYRPLCPPQHPAIPRRRRPLGRQRLARRNVALDGKPFVVVQRREIARLRRAGRPRQAEQLLCIHVPGQHAVHGPPGLPVRGKYRLRKLGMKNRSSK